MGRGRGKAAMRRLSLHTPKSLTAPLLAAAATGNTGNMGR